MRYGGLVIIAAFLLLPSCGRLMAGDESPSPAGESPSPAGELLSPAGEFVDTREGKAIVLPGSDSPDGRYAVAWTIRARNDHAPGVDWSLWDAQKPWAILDHYRVRDGKTAAADYLVRWMLVDLRSHRAGLLETNWHEGGIDPFPSRLEALWGAGRNGRPYVLVTRVTAGTTSADLLWAEGNDIMDDNLTLSLWGGISSIARRLRPALEYNEEAQFLPGPGKEGAARFRDGAVEIPFHAGPVEPPGKAADLLGIDGVVSFDLAERHPAPHASSDAKMDDPFESDQDVSGAYADYGRAYEALADRYAKAGFEKMPDAFAQDDDAWVQARTKAVIAAVEKAEAAGGDVRAAEKRVLLESLRARTELLKSPAYMKTPAELKKMFEDQPRVIPD